MDDDDLTCSCPHCNGLIGFDEVGQPYAIEEAPLAEGEFKGIRGIRVQEATPEWKHDNYFFNQAKQETSKALQPLGVAGKPYWVEPDPAPVDEELVATTTDANTEDLKARGLV